MGDRGGRPDRSSLAHAAKAAGNRRTAFDMDHVHMGNLDGGRYDVIGQARAHELTVFVVDHLFVERSTNALRDTAVNLTVHDHRIDDAAAIFRDHIFVDLHKTGGGIDLDGSQMGGACGPPV